MLPTLLALALTLSACAKMVGPYYLEQEEYAKGIEVLEQNLREHPDDAESAYYIGRFHLALKEAKQALPYLEQAQRLDPDNADYRFWTGVAHWALLDFDAERAAYLETLRIDPNHIPANLYLGHGYLDQGQWAKALVQYDTVIKLDKYNPEALYNRAAALGQLGKAEMELAAWKTFLEAYPDGSLALAATERLNLLGDFTYRNFIIGKRNVTLRTMAFNPGTARLLPDSKESLHVLAAMMTNNPSLRIHVVAYVQGNRTLAEQRARSVRSYMLSGHPEFDPERLPLSWFDSAEIVRTGGRALPLNESVQFITATR